VNGNPVRIAIVAPLVTPLREPFLGGGQALVHDLAEGLAAHGHAVSCFAADGSRAAGVEMVALGIDADRLRPAAFSGGLDPDPADAERQRAAFLRIAYEIRRRQTEFDVVHSHAFDAPAFELMSEAHPRVIHTLHLPPVIPGVVAATRQASAAGARLVTVSRTAAAGWESEGIRAGVIVNGVPVSRIPLGAGPRQNWLYVGRIAPEKGLEDALAAAEQAGRRLRIAGGIYDAAYHARLAPRLQSHDVLGALPRAAVFDEMARAAALLFPARWDEPFGLAAVESMAAGCPVAGYRRGALQEIIDDGTTGVLVTAGDVPALAAAANRSSQLKASDCRRWVERNFDLSRMIDDYVRLYREVGA
jgi:glycosyltransferase involved in cell wall biosynthesis